jgi:hypothetical protein|tara:strand:- start:247 stop:1014 length:768 start_codon:yes stop_codon:yes gene_type:complete
MAKDVTKGGNTEVMDPNMFEMDAGVGNENLCQDDLALPFLKIISGLDSILDTHESARKGDILNTVSGKVYSGKEGIRVVPCAYSRKFIQWQPRGQGSGAPMNIFGTNDKLPVVKRDPADNKDYVVGGDGDYIEETHQHYVVLINVDGSAETALVAMKSTQLKKSRKWNSMISSTMINGKNGPFQAPRFSHVYNLKTYSEENSKGSWHGWEMSREGPIQAANLYNQCKTFAKSVSEGDVVVKHQDETETDKGDAPF